MTESDSSQFKPGLNQPIQDTVLKIFADEVAVNRLNAALPLISLNHSNIQASRSGIENVVNGRGPDSANQGMNCARIVDGNIVLEENVIQSVGQGRSLASAVMYCCFKNLERNECYHARRNCPIQDALDIDLTNPEITYHYPVVRFVRIKDYEYLGKLLNKDVRSLRANAHLIQFVHEENLSQRRMFYDYLNAAAASTEYLERNLSTQLLQSKPQFEELMRVYTELGAYSNKTKRMSGKEYRNRFFVDPALRGMLRDVIDGIADEPDDINEPKINGIKISEIESDTLTLSEKLHVLRFFSGRAMTAETQSERLDGAINGLYLNQKSWLWHNASHSRSMNYFNVLLESMGLNAISHGFTDYVAHNHSYFDFRKYVRHIIEEVEGQTL